MRKGIILYVQITCIFLLIVLIKLMKIYGHIQKCSQKNIDRINYQIIEIPYKYYDSDTNNEEYKYYREEGINKIMVENTNGFYLLKFNSESEYSLDITESDFIDTQNQHIFDLSDNFNENYLTLEAINTTNNLNLENDNDIIDKLRIITIIMVILK